jgi:hypothetical protein
MLLATLPAQIPDDPNVRHRRGRVQWRHRMPDVVPMQMVATAPEGRGYKALSLRMKAETLRQL